MTSLYTIMQRVPGMNGKNGLLREHWSNRKKRKDSIKLEFLSQRQNKPKHTGKVVITYINYYATHPMDWDNFCSSFKLIGDSLTDLGTISDDSPKIVVGFIPKQIKCNKIDQRIEIVIEDE